MPLRSSCELVQVRCIVRKNANSFEQRPCQNDSRERYSRAAPADQDRLKKSAAKKKAPEPDEDDDDEEDEDDDETEEVEDEDDADEEEDDELDDEDEDEDEDEEEEDEEEESSTTNPSCPASQAAMPRGRIGYGPQRCTSRTESMSAAPWPGRQSTTRCARAAATALP